MNEMTDTNDPADPEVNRKATGNTPFQINNWHIDPETCRIQQGDKVVKLEPKVMTVLVCLAEEAGKVISREQLEARAWPGMVVGYDSLASAIIKLRKAFGDDSKNPTIIETVSKKGYRLIAPVSITETPSPASTRIRRPKNRGHLAIIVLVIALGTWLLFKPETLTIDSTTDSVSKPTIAVLPFKNISNDPQQDYFSDGITADLITDLSKISGLSVIARNSVFIYKQTNVDIRKIGKELNVNYVIEGSVRKVGNQIRITASLIDARNSLNLWADRFDGTLDNVFALQDDVTSKIIASLEIRLTDDERQRLARQYTNSIEAYDLFLHGWQNLWIASRESNLEARDYFLKAIEVDEKFARAYANLAITYIYDYMNRWSDDSELSLQRGNYYADKAIELDSKLSQVHWAKGFTEVFNKNYKNALKEAQLAIQLDPNYADGYGLLANVLNYAGQARQAKVEMQKAMSLNPAHPHIYKVIYGEILFNLYEYEAAIDSFKHALERNPEIQEARIWLAASYAQSEQIEEAHWQLEQIRHTDTEISLRWIEQTSPLQDPTQRKHLFDALLKAGLDK
jgi:TolB-like protein/DNA-binding winged helix-turn-helix (wHTH) protein/Flp pilus assembly protein TadD